MQTFKDTKGRTWTIQVNIGTLMRAKDLTGIDLSNLGDGKLLAKLQDEPLMIGHVLFPLCQPNADPSITEADFWSAIDGDVIEAAGKALVTELVNFSRKDLRPVLNKVLDKSQRLRAKAIQLANKQVDDPALEATALARMQQALSGSSSGAAPASSTSIPDLTPSAS